MQFNFFLGGRAEPARCGPGIQEGDRGSTLLQGWKLCLQASENPKEGWVAIIYSRFRFNGRALSQNTTFDDSAGASLES